ncbi:MAG: hypothetical protein NT062_00400 [Proteobacteria bacterium]|nr:hypothetical protein [Pseudomonadota bacterium]
MMRTNLTFLFTTLALVGCSTDPATATQDAAPEDASVDAPPWTNGTSTLTGSEEAAYLDGVRGRARLNNPVNVLVHGDVIYVADFDNGKIRQVTADGTTTTLVAQPDFLRPFAMTFGGDGRLYATTDKATDGTLSDMSGTVWRIEVASGTATVVAARIGRPRGLAWFEGKLAVSDFTHHVVQLVDPNTGAVTPYAGTWNAAGMVDATGAAARFTQPYGLAVDGERLLVADFGNHRVRAIAHSGVVTTFAGAGTMGFAEGGTTTAQFHNPQGLAIDQAGDLFVTDTGNFRVRRVRDENVDTVAGNGAGGYVDHDNNLAAAFFGLEGLSVSADGTMLYVADGNRGEDRPFNRVRAVKLP